MALPVNIDDFLREKIFKHDDRPEADRIWNYPYRAIEEALANAVYHKSYRIPEPITVVVTPTEMTISSLPGPERSITDEDLKSFHIVGLQYRNRRIGEFLKELDLVEGRNTGVPVIVSAMRHNGSPDPVFSTPETRDWLSVVLPINDAFRCKNTHEGADMSAEGIAPKDAPIIASKSSIMSSIKSSVMSSIMPPENGMVGATGHVMILTEEEELSEISSEIVAALKRSSLYKSATVVGRMSRIVQEMRRDHFVSIMAVAKAFKLSRRTVDEDIAVLRKINVVKKSGATRNAQWKVLI